MANIAIFDNIKFDNIKHWPKPNIDFKTICDAEALLTFCLC